MIMDFHTHVKLSKKTSFNLSFFQEIVLNAKEAGLDAIAMTEHFNTDNYQEIFEVLDAHYPYTNDHYTVDGLYIFPGMEVDVAGIGHILCITGKRGLLEMRQQLEGHTDAANFITLEELLRLGRSYGALMIGAHPLRPSTPLLQHDAKLLEQLDAFDLNGKDLHEHGVVKMKLAVEQFAEGFGKPIVYGSDSHHPIHIGISKNHFPVTCETVEEIRALILAGHYTSTVSPVLHTKVNAAKIVKKKMKEAILTL